MIPKSSPRTNISTSFRKYRFLFVGFIFLALAGALIAQVFYLQVIKADDLIKQANNRSIRVQNIEITRGKIVDRNGNFLALSVPVYSIVIDPKEYFAQQIKRNKDRWKALAIETNSSLGRIEDNVHNFLQKKYNQNKIALTNEQILNPYSKNYWQLLSEVSGIDLENLTTNVKNDPTSKFLAFDKNTLKSETQKFSQLAKQLNQSFTTLINNFYSKANSSFLYLAKKQNKEVSEFANQLGIKTLEIKKESMRVYPLGKATSQLLGLTDLDDKVGIEGLERTYNQFLLGDDQKITYRKDKRGRRIETIKNEQPAPQFDLQLSIDADLQTMVFNELQQAVEENKAESGTAVLINIKTGEILALATAPSFDPNNRSTIKQSLVRNRAVTDTFEPGSTVKPFVILNALQNKVIGLNDVIDTGPLELNGHQISDVGNYKQLDLTGILQKSSNRGMSRIALKMTPEQLIDTYRKVGFGKATELGLNEAKGTNGNRTYWTDLEKASLAYGYGLRVTPVQLARAYVILGNKGKYRELSITQVSEPTFSTQVFDKDLTQKVLKMLEATTSPEGTGHRAALKNYRTAVKTGTTRKLEQGKYVAKYIAYTAGLAPVSDPIFSLVVLINEPTAGKFYGGAVSAPLFASIMEKALEQWHIAPDKNTNK